jgi:hypothetical protein
MRYKVWEKKIRIFTLKNKMNFETLSLTHFSTVFFLAHSKTPLLAALKATSLLMKDVVCLELILGSG